MSVLVMFTSFILCVCVCVQQDECAELVPRSSLEAELSAKEREMLQLVEDVQRLQASLSSLRERSDTHSNRLQQQLQDKTTALQVQKHTQLLTVHCSFFHSHTHTQKCHFKLRYKFKF